MVNIPELGTRWRRNRTGHGGRTAIVKGVETDYAGRMIVIFDDGSGARWRMSLAAFLHQYAPEDLEFEEPELDEVQP